jgi:hypothetical protein
MAKASITINDEFTFIWYKVTAGHTAQKRNIPEFVRHFFEQNVSDRSELKGEEFFDRYVLKWYEGGERVKNPSFGSDSRSEQYRANPDVDSLFLVEVELTYRKGKTGGFLYRPSFTTDSEIEVTLLEVIKDNENETHYRFQVTGSLFWDYKSSHYKKQVEAIEKDGDCTWEDVRVEVRINLRDNYEVKKVFIYDDKGYYLPEQPMETIDDKVMGKPEDETNLCFMLEMTPNVFSLVNDEEPSHVNHARFSDKNIHMKCKYLSF